MDDDLRKQLLGSVTEGALLFNSAIRAINYERREKDKIPLSQLGEYRERAEEWLTDARLEAATQLPATEDEPRLVIPRLNRPVTSEEVVRSWKHASKSAYLEEWGYRMKFFANWTADELSGYDPEQAEAERLAIVPTKRDKKRSGTVARQRAELERLQEESPELDVATIFDGSVLARSHMNHRISWGSYVRGINLEQVRIDNDTPLVPAAGLGPAGGYNFYVGKSYVDHADAARLRVI